MGLTHRERVNLALNHEQPDRVPIDLGGSCVTSISASTYTTLRQYLGVSQRETRISETVQQIAWVDEDILEILGVDVIPLWANAPKGYKPVFCYESDGTVSFIDEFGATLHKPANCCYFEWCQFPLSEPSIDSLKAMLWPDVEDPARYAGLRERAFKLRNQTDYAIFGMAPCGHDLFNQLLRVRGMVEGLSDLLLNEEFVEAFLSRLTATIIRAQELFLDEVGDLIDVHFAADDLSGQTGPLISPKLYRKLIKPRWAQIIKAIKSKTKAKISYHSCGAITEFIPDLIDIGIDIINPVQVSAVGMDTADLKRKYGKHLCFWGGGCDTQHILPFETPKNVVAETCRRIKDLAPGGGFVFNPVHNIQHGVPPINIMAMFSAAQQCGQYAV
jgi:uroporphyrinogen decarboxylase